MLPAKYVGQFVNLLLGSGLISIRTLRPVKDVVPLQVRTSQGSKCAGIGGELGHSVADLCGNLGSAVLGTQAAQFLAFSFELLVLAEAHDHLDDPVGTRNDTMRVTGW
ncbi:hypothetical protein [Nocardia pseudovaccinii]|uniref:hypothetical protein n=1 Tax=Nocardia pseudovaccinii TaxID=189540 RepID=UPI0007A42DFA|nr:hypothetical protein [Nocardia pseudovaccinii]